MSPKPKSLACWQHGLPAGTATIVVRFSDTLRNSRCVGSDVHTHARGTYARRAPAPDISAGPKPAVVELSSGMLRDSRCVGTDVHTHERGTYARRGKHQEKVLHVDMGFFQNAMLGKSHVNMRFFPNMATGLQSSAGLVSNRCLSW
jgi:hypothetical protein